MMGWGQSGLVRRSHLFLPATADSAINISNDGDGDTFYVPTSKREITPLNDSMQFFVRDLIAAHRAPWTTKDQRIRPWGIIEQARFDALEPKAATPSVVEPPANQADKAASKIFENGTVVRFQNCVRLVEFNNKLGRLYPCIRSLAAGHR